MAANINNQSKYLSDNCYVCNQHTLGIFNYHLYGSAYPSQGYLGQILYP